MYFSLWFLVLTESCLIKREFHSGFNWQVFSNSPAEGELQRGDVILAINGRDASTLTHKQAQDSIKFGGGQVELLVSRWRIDASINLFIRCIYIQSACIDVESLIIIKTQKTYSINLENVGFEHILEPNLHTCNCKECKSKYKPCGTHCYKEHTI